MNEKRKGKDRKAGSVRGFPEFISGKNWTFAAVVAILVLNVFLRTPMLRFQGFFEPDGFFYYAVVRQAVQSNFHVINYLNVSGFPKTNFIGEAPGLIYLVVVPYFFLRFFGISYYTIMRLMPVLFGITYAVLAYYLAKYLANSRALGLLAMLFVTVSIGNISKTAALVYRGDSFISLFLLLSLLFMLKTLESTDTKGKYLNTGISAFVLSLGITVWTGYSFIIAIYMLTLLILLAYGFVKADHDLLWTNTLLTVGLLGASLLDDAWVLLGLGRAGSALGGAKFFLFWIPIILGNALAIYLIKNKHKINLIGSVEKRIGVVLAVVAVMLVLYLVLFGEVIGSILGSVGITNAASSPIGGTTQELQKPSYAFLFASFNFQLYFAPIAVLLFFLFSDRIHGRDQFKIKGITINMSQEFVALLSYLAITSYLQLMAVRWSALLSVPIAVFAAYGAYIVWVLIMARKVNGRMLLMGAMVLFDVLVVLIISFNATQQFGVNNMLLAATAFLVTALLTFSLLYDVRTNAKSALNLRYVYVAFLAVLLLLTVYDTVASVFTTTQADDIGPQFLGAMMWMRNNTPANATVLSLWADGSVIEGWANRTGFTDTVGGENASRIYSSSRFLLNTSADTQYLYEIGRPQYIVVRRFWFQEITSIATEANVSNATYGYALFSSPNVTRNSTARTYSFTSYYPNRYKSIMVAEQETGGSRFFAYLRNGSAYVPIKHVMLLNTTSYLYSISNTSASNALNYTLLVTYTDNGIGGGMLLNHQLFESNAFKLAFLCNYQECPYSDANVSLTAAYLNNDTRIFKLNYR